MAKDKDIQKAEDAAQEKEGCVAVGVFDDKGNFMREYSAEIHGEIFLENAKEFSAQYSGSTIKKLR